MKSHPIRDVRVTQTPCDIPSVWTTPTWPVMPGRGTQTSTGKGITCNRYRMSWTNFLLTDHNNYDNYLPTIASASLMNNLLSYKRTYISM